MQNCLAEFPTKVTARATNPPPYSITRLFVPCTSFRFYYSFFFYNQKSANPYVFLVYTYLKENNSRSTVDCKWGCICFSSSQRIIDSGHGMIISSFSKSPPFFFSNWIFHHDYEIKRKSVDVKKVFTQFQKNLDYRRSSRISG